MVYLFTGEDTKSKLIALDLFLSSMASDVETLYIDKSSFDQTQTKSFFSGNDLFSKKIVIVFQGILEKEEETDFIISNLAKLGESENVFVFSEGELKKGTIDAFKKARAEINVFEALKGKVEKFNNFLLANALGEKNKLELWIYFRQAMDKGVQMEALLGVLFWKVKDMILKKNFTKFTKEQLEKIAADLSYLLPKARGSRVDDEAMFEKFLLEAF